jgi:hypothetical protein
MPNKWRQKEHWIIFIATLYEGQNLDSEKISYSQISMTLTLIFINKIWAQSEFQTTVANHCNLFSWMP